MSNLNQAPEAGESAVNSAQQSIAQSTALAMADATDNLRNLNTLSTTAIGVALSQFLETGFVDSFRALNKEPHNYTWWSYRAGARGKNLGWRIDYHFISENLEDKLKRSVILSEAVHSDHCPLMVELDVQL